MFYLQYSLWLGLYFFVWSFFKIRKLIFKILKYPVYPESFNFDQLPLFWKYLLVYFYSDKNFLSKLPLENDDINKILHFRKFINFHFYKFLYAKEFGEIKKKITFVNFNNFKKQYKIFLNCSKNSIFLNYFFGEGNFFLKFIFVKKYILKQKYWLFFYNYFYKSLKNFSKINLRQIYSDYFTLISLCLFKNSNKLLIVKIYESLTMLVFHKILNSKEKSISVNRNFYWEKNYFWLKYFIKMKYILLNKLTNSYKNLWGDYLIKNDNLNKVLGFSFKNFLKNYPVKYFDNFTEFFKNYWPSRLQNSSFTKFTDINNNNSLLFFLRKNKIFNKGRYSRNRQIYRTGVYMCLWINIIFVYFYIFSFYRFTFNFGFLWFGIGLLIISMVIGRSAKYRLYNFKNFLNELILFFKWIGFFAHNVFLVGATFFKKSFSFFLKNKSI